MTNNKSKPMKRSRDTARREEKTRHPLSNKPVNEIDSEENLTEDIEPTTPLISGSPFNSFVSENWPTAYLENGGFFVDSIRSAASGSYKGGSIFEVQGLLLEANEQFRHYDVLDELLCEQVDPSFSLVPTPKSKAPSLLPAKTATTFAWDDPETEKSLHPLELLSELSTRLGALLSKFQEYFNFIVFDKSTQKKQYYEGSKNACLRHYFVFLWIDATFSRRENTPDNIDNTNKSTKPKGLLRIQSTIKTILRALKLSKKHPFTALFIASFTLTFTPPFLVIATVMSVISIIIATTYLGIFLCVSFVTSLLVIPLLAMSVFFATGATLCGILSSMFFEGAQQIYNYSKTYKDGSLRSMANQFPPSTDFEETDKPKIKWFPDLWKLYEKAGHSAPQPIVIMGSSVREGKVETS